MLYLHVLILTFCSLIQGLYDKVLKAKKANELRNRELDAKRRKVKEGKLIFRE